MPPSVAFTALATPADFSLPSPLPVHFLPEGAVQSLGAAALRYLVKLSVVPDWSERKKTLMAWSGSLTPGLMAAIAGSFQVVMTPLKILAVTAGVRISLSTPLRLYPTAMGPVTMGRFQAGEAHALSASACSILVDPAFGLSASAESDPAKSTWPAMICLMPAPEPVGL